MSQQFCRCIWAKAGIHGEGVEPRLGCVHGQHERPYVEFITRSGEVVGKLEEHEVRGNSAAVGLKGCECPLKVERTPVEDHGH